MSPPISLYNSLSRSVEPFVPQVLGHVSMYVCGPTVYDTPHLGNARPAIVFDVLYRLLREYYEVDYARNFTDVDDKIMDRARENGETITDLTERVIQEYYDIVDTLNVLRPTFEPRVTSSILAIRNHIAELIAKGHAYVSEGHVLFDVESFPQHGILSGHDQADLRAGSRIEPASYKRSPADFVLWKPSTGDQPGWDSEWGRGRPGWHIECSAMIGQIFHNQTIDIHGGGNDLRFPHHDCEISQYQAAHDRDLARYWVHNGMLLVNGEKMAKSAGNFTTVRQLIDAGVSGDAIRLTMLLTHYRSPLNWTGVDLAEGILNRVRHSLTPFRGMVVGTRNEHTEAAMQALGSDLNTPLAITHIQELVTVLNRTGDATVAEAIVFLLSLLGILEDAVGVKTLDPESQALFDERAAARAARDWDRSDQLRAQLRLRGIVVEDGKDGQRWMPV